MARPIRIKGLNRPVPAVRTRLIGPALLVSVLGWGGPALAQVAEPPQQQQTAQEAGEGALVACLLPAEIERFGTQLTIVGARQRVETSRADCAERGGEVVEEGAAPSEPGR